MSGAASLLPDAGRALLITGDADAFSRLLLILTAVTVATAAVVFLSLNKGTQAEDDVPEIEQTV